MTFNVNSLLSGFVTIRMTLTTLTPLSVMRIVTKQLRLEPYARGFHYKVNIYFIYYKIVPKVQ